MGTPPGKRRERKQEQERSDSFLEIDEHRLHEEWMNQPRLYFRWAEKLAEAKQRLEEAKAELELVRAELDYEVRSNPEQYNLDKITEAVVKATVNAQERYREAERAVISCKHAVDVHQAAVNALDHRKRALQGLVELFLANYFAVPRAPDTRTHGELEEFAKDDVRRRGRRRREREEEEESEED